METPRPPLTPPSPPTERATVSPVLPLLLLKTVRDMDLPPEFLEEENLYASMPRRFGLNQVVNAQIDRFQEEVRRGRPQPDAVVTDLVRLVIRRPDAEEVFEEAGRGVARHFWERRPAPLRKLIRLLPAGLSLRLACQELERLLEEIAGRGRAELEGGGERLVIHDCLGVMADPGGAACALYAGAASELFGCYTGKDYRARHFRCGARGDDSCEWRIYENA
ncbi:MAG: V4R domain-containing protein [Longimicrobiaceae bacterium]